MIRNVKSRKKEVTEIKILSKKKNSMRIRAELSSVLGLREGGFFEGCAEKLINLRVRGGALCLRDGISEGPFLRDEIIFAQSVVCGGSSIGFIADKNAMYAVYGHTTNEEPGEPVLFEGVDPENAFVFSTGNHVYLFSSGKFLIFNGAEFSDVFASLHEITVKDNRITRSALSEGVNLLTGKVKISFSPSEETGELIFEEEIESAEDIIFDGEDISSSANISSDKRRLIFSSPISPSGLLTLTVTPKKYAAAENEDISLFCRASSETGECYVCDRERIYRISSDSDGKLFLSSPIFESGRNSIRACFFCSGRLAAAVGGTIGLIENGKLTAIDSEGIRSKDSVCTGGAYAYLNTGEHVTRISFSPSGSSYEVKCTTHDNSFAKREPMTPVCMTYSPFDRSLYSISVKAPYRSKPSLFSLDTQNGVWTEIEGISSPKYCFSLDGSVAVTSGNRLYFIVDGQGGDRTKSESFPIEGRILTCRSDLSLPCERKRVLSASASLSGIIEDFTLTLSADNGESDLFRYENPSYSANVSVFPVCRMNIGRFSFAMIEARLRGYSGAALHDVYIDLKRT